MGKKNAAERPMSKEEYRAVLDDVIWLSACAVNGEVPDAKRIKGMDLDLLYRASRRHLLTAIVGYALEGAGVNDHVFTQAKAKAIRKLGLMDAEMAVLFGRLEQAGIWYAPLKGTVLKDFYPAYGLRQMADHDILFDEKYADEVKSILEDMGFASEHFGASNHDCYYKKPVCNFEMHRTLFGESHENSFQEYYGGVKERLLKDGDNRYGYHFSPEDFYVYMIAHEYKHYSGGGTGLRSLLDTYVYLNKNGDGMDFSYIVRELERMGIADFELRNRELSRHLFSGEVLTEEEEKMLGYILDSGTYGTIKHSVENQIAKKGRWGYFWSRAFLPYDQMVRIFPVLKTLPVLLPVCWVWRLVAALIFKHDRVMYQLRAVFGKIE